MQHSRIRALVHPAALAVFAAQFAILDGLFRGPHAWTEPRVAVAVVESVVVWCALALAARTRPARIALALVASLLVVVQAFVFRYYHVPLDVQVAASALFAWHDVRRVMVHALPYVSALVIVGAAVELVLLEVAHRDPAARSNERSRRADVLLALAALAGLFGPGPRRATPDVRGVHALTALGTRRAEPRRGGEAPELPPLHAERSELPSVLFVLTESVRAEDYVTAGEGATATETLAVVRRLAHAHVELREMRAVSSYTALSVSALLTGRSQEGARDEIMRSPSLFDYARAARSGRGEPPFVSYFASQSEEIFETKEVRAAAARFVTVETLLGRPVGDESSLDGLPLDRQIVDRFVADLPTLPRSSVTVLHLYGTHAPYFFDDDRAAFRPFDRVVAWSRMPKLRNAYKNAIVAQDHELARAVSAFVEHARGRPWLVVFTSDHGEAFGEHGAIHHGQNLYDEQVHVPGWIAAGPGTLSAEQEHALLDHAGRFVTHLDVLPTILDALGLWDNFELRARRAAMPGKSLLRPFSPRPPVPVTNCTGMFPCPLETWGLFDGDHKLVAQLWDGNWACLDLTSSERIAGPDDPACPRLREVSRRHFPRLPNGAPNQ